MCLRPSRSHVALLALVVAGLAATCGGERDRLGPPGTVVELSGIVEEIDASAMPVDGDGILRVRLASGSHARVRVPSGETRCPAPALETFARLRPGDSVVARGTIVGPRSVRVCAEGDRLRRGADPP